MRASARTHRAACGSLSRSTRFTLLAQVIIFLPPPPPPLALLVGFGTEGGRLGRNMTGLGFLDPFTQRLGRHAQIAGDFALPASTEDERNGLLLELSVVSPTEFADF